MSDAEKKDVYIAAGVGGLALVLIYLFLYSGTNSAAPVADDGSTLPTVAAVAPIDQTPYNYNVQPFNPTPGIQYAANPFDLSTNDNSPSGDCCCDTCGPQGGGASFANPGVAVFSTLIGYGSASGAA